MAENTENTEVPAKVSLRTVTPELVAWSAGLLEGEGYFFLHNAQRLGVRLVMTDRDVVSRFAEIWGVQLGELKKRKPEHKQPYAVSMYGEKAAQCMRLTLPFFGIRRTSCIRDCLTGYTTRFSPGGACRKNPPRRCSDETLKSAWENRIKNQSFRGFCKSLALNNTASVKARLQRLGLLDYRETKADTPAPYPEPLVLAEQSAEIQTAWLAGLIEGEGCFQQNVNSPQVHLLMTDEDIVSRFATLTHGRYKASPPLKSHWKHSFKCTISAELAHKLMLRILPWMGERRAAKIEECLKIRSAYVKKRSEELIAHETRANSLKALAELDRSDKVAHYYCQVCGARTANRKDPRSSSKYCSRSCAGKGASLLRKAKRQSWAVS